MSCSKIKDPEAPQKTRCHDGFIYQWESQTITGMK